jgi:NADPH:quinone reductase-like Zn-dependent oxidoreductase
MDVPEIAPDEVLVAVMAAGVNYNNVWAYETNWGSFTQFCKVQDHQCLPKPKHLSWEEAAAYMLVGATAYRMLHHWEPNTVKKDDVVLIWGGAGGLGAMAIQIVKAAGGIPIAVVSSDDKIEFCKNLGAAGVINRIIEVWARKSFSYRNRGSTQADRKSSIDSVPGCLP